MAPAPKTIAKIMIAINAIPANTRHPATIAPIIRAFLLLFFFVLSSVTVVYSVSTTSESVLTDSVAKVSFVSMFSPLFYIIFYLYITKNLYHISTGMSNYRKLPL